MWPWLTRVVFVIVLISKPQQTDAYVHCTDIQSKPHWRVTTMCIDDNAAAVCPGMQQLQVEAAYFGYRHCDAMQRKRDGNCCYNSAACGSAIYNGSLHHDVMFDITETCGGRIVSTLKETCAKDCTIVSPMLVVSHCEVRYRGKKIDPHYLTLFYTCHVTTPVAVGTAVIGLTCVFLAIGVTLCFRHVRRSVKESRPSHFDHPLNEPASPTRIGDPVIYTYGSNNLVRSPSNASDGRRPSDFPSNVNIAAQNDVAHSDDSGLVDNYDTGTLDYRSVDFTMRSDSSNHSVATVNSDVTTASVATPGRRRAPYQMLHLNKKQSGDQRYETLGQKGLKGLGQQVNLPPPIKTRHQSDRDYVNDALGPMPFPSVAMAPLPPPPADRSLSGPPATRAKAPRPLPLRGTPSNGLPDARPDCGASGSDHSASSEREKIYECMH